MSLMVGQNWRCSSITGWVFFGPLLGLLPSIAFFYCCHFITDRLIIISYYGCTLTKALIPWQHSKSPSSFHPNFYHCLSWLPWQWAQQGSPDMLLPSHFLQVLLGEPEAFLGQMEYIIPPGCSEHPHNTSTESKEGQEESQAICQTTPTSFAVKE